MGASWFTDMIKGNSWSILSRRLSRLDITFPSSHSINSYSLPLEDYTKLMQNLSNVRQLRLVGAGQGGPVPLIPTLRYCPHLTELTLEKSPVHVPDNYEVIDPTYISHSLQKFYYLGEMSSLLVHNYMMDWLFMALGAENANIHLQLSYKQHPQEYRR